ncbi:MULTISPECIES: hypothetical protein [unclassified Rhizobium]|jgi:hypothetical protein|nr:MULTISPECIES: hypothetical protein [unclassified Rhizobium]RKD45290.1 hypothetical protein BJ928_12363 [Rhizobium sp. WW_1]
MFLLDYIAGSCLSKAAAAKLFFAYGREKHSSVLLARTLKMVWLA